MTTIRPARREDLPAILAIYNEAVVNSTASWDLVPEESATREAWFDARQAAGHPVLVAEADGRVLGYGTWGTFRAKPGYARTMEHSLYLAPEARGRGVGRLLLAAIIDTARDAGVHTLIGCLDSTNEASVALHRGFGFVEVGRLRQAGAKFGRWLDLAFWQVLLDDEPAPTASA